MPNIIPIEKIIPQLPNFVKIIPETYRGMRYKTKFLDTEYNEEFWAVPRSVIQLQHGCKSRSNENRRKGAWRGGYGVLVPIEDVKKKLPPYLEIDESSYKGVREKARFYDKEYKIWFEMIVRNVIRTGKGYCEERKRYEFLRQIKVPIEVINQRIQRLYNGEISLVESSYVDTNSLAQFKNADGSSFKTTVSRILCGKGGRWRYLLNDWSGYIKVTANYTCHVCGKRYYNGNKDINSHHIFCWSLYPELRFHLENGLCLCSVCHIAFHSQYGKFSTLDLVNQWLLCKGIEPLQRPLLLSAYQEIKRPLL